MDERDEDLVCEGCGTTKNVTLKRDPYGYEIYDRENIIPLCDNCYHERVMDI